MKQSRRKLYSQNFLRSQSLANRLVALSSIGKNDLVLEIGPGSGRLTKPLLRRAGNVIAVEVDKKYVTQLRTTFANQPHLKVVHKGILEFRLPDQPYSVFSNIPFSIEGKILRYLLDARQPANEIFLVLHKEFAYKFVTHRPGFLPLSYLPWFSFEIGHQFRRTDFWPVPSIDAVLLKISHKNNPPLQLNERKPFKHFVKAGFADGLSIYKNLTKFYQDREKAADLLAKCSISKKAKPKSIQVDDWVELYKVSKHYWNDQKSSFPTAPSLQTKQ